MLFGDPPVLLREVARPGPGALEHLVELGQETDGGRSDEEDFRETSVRSRAALPGDLGGRGARLQVVHAESHDHEDEGLAGGEAGPQVVPAVLVLLDGSSRTVVRPFSPSSIMEYPSPGRVPSTPVHRSSGGKRSPVSGS